MALRILGRPARKPGWDELRARVIAALEQTAPGLAVSASDDPSSTWVAWHEGPAISTVQAHVGEVPGWQWAAVAPGFDAPLPPAPTPGETPILWVRRSFGERALLTSLVRFYGARTRHFTTDQERYRAEFAQLCDVDDPAHSGYPIVDHIVDAVLAAPAPTPPPDRHPIDVLSGRLAALGYEHLWHEAYKAVG